MQQEISALRQVIVAAVVAGIIGGLATIAANLTGDTHLTVIQQLLVSGLVSLIKAAQKWASTLDGGSQSSVMLGTK